MAATTAAVVLQRHRGTVYPWQHQPRLCTLAGYQKKAFLTRERRIPLLIPVSRTSGRHAEALWIPTVGCRLCILLSHQDASHHDVPITPRGRLARWRSPKQPHAAGGLGGTSRRRWEGSATPLALNICCVALLLHVSPTAHSTGRAAESKAPENHPGPWRSIFHSRSPSTRFGSLRFTVHRRSPQGTTRHNTTYTPSHLTQGIATMKSYTLLLAGLVILALVSPSFGRGG